MGSRVDDTPSYYFTETAALFTRTLPVAVSYNARQHSGKLLNSETLVRVTRLCGDCVSRCAHCFNNNKNICHSSVHRDLSYKQLQGKRFRQEHVRFRFSFCFHKKSIFCKQLEFQLYLPMPIVKGFFQVILAMLS